MIYINVVCDHIGDEKCRAAQSVGFDGLGETFGDLVTALRGIGWTVFCNGESRSARCLCPEHVEGSG